jgi:hypothetical protein
VHVAVDVGERGNSHVKTETSLRPYRLPMLPAVLRAAVVGVPVFQAPALPGQGRGARTAAAWKDRLIAATNWLPGRSACNDASQIDEGVAGGARAQG